METREQIEKFKEFFEKNHLVDLNKSIREQKRSYSIDFVDFSLEEPELAEELLEQPEEILKAAELSLDDLNIPEKNIRIRVQNLPKTAHLKIRNIRSMHLGKFLSFEGIVRQSSDVRPQVTNARFECPSCGNIISILQLDQKFKEPTRCTCGRRGHFRMIDKDLVDAQRLVIEEPPESLEGGEQPKRLSVFLKEDLVEPHMERKTTPGSKIRITGVVKEVPIQLKTGVQSIRYDIAADAIHVEPIEQTYEDIEITEEDKEKINDLAKDPALYERLINSIAPSVYGYDETKEALVLQLVGGVRRERPDGTKVRGDIHILLVGDPGAAKCVHGDTKITLNDGRVIKAKELVEKHLENPNTCDDGLFQKTRFSLPTLGFDCKQQEGLCSTVWKRTSPENLYKITTETGNEIIVSPTHPMFTITQGIVHPRTAETLKAKEFIACPRSLKINTTKQKIPFITPRTPAKNGNHIIQPQECDQDLARLIGYLISDSYMSYSKTSGETVFVNNDPILLEDFRKLTTTLFNIQPKPKKSNKTTKELRINSIELTRFFEKIEPTLLKRSKHKKIPEIIMKSPNEIVKEFIKGYFDGEANVENEKREIKVSSASKELIYDLRNLLLRVGILAQTHLAIRYATNTIKKTKRPYWTLSITGKEIVTYSEKIGFTSEEKQRKLALLLKSEKVYNTNIDVIPNISEPLKKIRKKLKLTQFEMGIPRTTYQHFERGDRNPSRTTLRKILATAHNRLQALNTLLLQEQLNIKEARESLYLSQENLANSIKHSQTLISHYETGKSHPQQQILIQKSLQQEIQNILEDYELEALLTNLEYLAYSDIFWDRIKTIEKLPSDQEYVYDLTVDTVHNFVANNFFCHNSTMLTFLEKAAPKARYVAGRSASGAGITAAVVKDEFLKGWALEAGAVVLANKGILLIDEMDKMSVEDTSALHEAMAQQQVTISKANIQAVLRAQTSILAAANPKLGRFDPFQPIGQQIDLPPALINRFDLIFPVRDMPSREIDEKIALHILEQDFKGRAPEIPLDFLKKYVSYAKQQVKPMLSKQAIQEIKSFYVGLRNAGGHEEGKIKPIPISARQLESIIRLAEASARVRLGDTVTQADAQRAIKLVTHCLTQVGIDPETGQIDIDRISTGITANQRSRISIIREIIDHLEQKIGKSIPIEDIMAEAAEKGLTESQVEEVIERFKREGHVFEPKRGQLSKL